MAPTVVVLGAGYAGTGTILGLEDRLGDAELVWVSETDHHLVLHEAHRVIRDPALREKVTIPVDEIKDRETTFVEATVTDVDTDTRTVHLDVDDSIEYDYVVICLGSGTAFYGIEGLQEHAHTLNNLADAIEIHDATMDAAAGAAPSGQAEIIVGGAGLSGIQIAGELAELRHDRDLSLEITLIEGLDTILPNGDVELQSRLETALRDANVNVETGEFITGVDSEAVALGYDRAVEYDVLIWTGGITGREATAGANVNVDERDRRLVAGADFTTSDDRVFAVGDVAHVQQPDDTEAPPTAQAAWDAAEVVAENVSRRIEGRPLQTWHYEDLGTLISVGDRAFAHDIRVPPGIRLPVKTFSGTPAVFFKKAAAARWIGRVSSWERALKAWSAL